MKRFLSMILALTLVFSLAACGGKEDTKKTSKKSEKTEATASPSPTASSKVSPSPKSQTPSASTPSSASTSGKIYSGSDFSFSYPSDWSETTVVPGATVGLMSQVDGTSVAIAAVMVDNSEQDLETITKEALEETINTPVDSITNATFAGEKAKLARASNYTDPSTGVKADATVYALNHSGKCYIVVFMATSSKSSYTQGFNQITSSFKFK